MGLKFRLGVLLSVLTLLTNRAHADDSTNQFLFLTLRLKNGVVTLEKAQIVTGKLKPQSDSNAEESLIVSLEKAAGDAHWKLAIADPSFQRLEYEDPQQPGALKSKTVHVDDVEFIVRTPLIPGIRQMAIHRKKKPAPPTTAAPADEKRLLARIELPKSATR